LYQFKGDLVAEAFSRQVLHAPWNQETNDANDTYYRRFIMPRMTNEMTLNIFYKNSNGVWVDYTKLVTAYPRISIAISAVQFEDIVKIDPLYIPRCVYLDNDHYVHYIDEHDGIEEGVHVPNIELDTHDTSVFSFRPWSIEEPTLPFSARHIMTDLKVQTKGFPAKSLLVWLNGIFTPIIQDDTYEDTFYVKNALTTIGSRCINQQFQAPWRYKSNRNATVTEDEFNNEYRYDARFRFFCWEGVSLSKWHAPIIVGTLPITHNYSSVSIINSCIFPEAVNKDAHMIMENGIILDQSEYSIDEEDPRKIYLKTVESRAYNLLHEIINDLNVNLAFYSRVKPLAIITPTITAKTYSLVNFTPTDPSKRLFLKRSIACATDFPYKKEVTFSDIQLGDLITVNGTYNEYEWVHEHTISYPVFRLTYNEEESHIRESEVVRFYFISKP
jgi:hypothetical protein